jgi:ATP-dependent RNA helicase HelY
MIVLLSVAPGTLESTMTEDLSPAERYAAARQRAAEQATALASFREMYDFGLDPFQIEACQALEAGKGVLVAAPTGSGKTIVGEFAVHLALLQGRKCFYTTPIKALSNQKYADLCRRYGDGMVGLLTGDNSINSEAPVVVMTTEVLRNMLYAGSQTLLGLGHVVMDEVHYLSDRFRGAVWEEVIIHLPESVTLVSLSATVSNAEEFGDWLDTVRGDTEVIVSEHRPVPLFQHVLAGRRMYDLFEEGEGHKKAVNPDLTRLARMEATRPSYQDRRRGRAMREADRERERRQRSRVWTPGRPEVIERLDAEGLLPAITFIFSRAACEVPARGTAAERRGGAGQGARPGRGAHRRHPDRGSARPRLLRMAGRPGARHSRSPRRHAADLQGGRRGTVRARAGEGRVRHGDPGAGHQHACPVGGVGKARQVERRAARRHHAR